MNKKQISKSVFAAIIIMGLAGFDLFNYVTSAFALGSFGDITFNAFGISIKASIGLALAFCAVDFAGISSIFTEESWPDEPLHVWLLTGGWFIASIVNATLTWWAMVLAVSASATAGNALFTKEQIVRVVPLITAASVFMIRILIIGSIVAADEKKTLRPAPKVTSLPAKTKSSSFINRPLPQSQATAVPPKKAEPSYRVFSAKPSQGAEAPSKNGGVKIHEIGLDDLPDMISR